MIGNNRIQCDDDPCDAELTYPVEDEPDGFVAGTIEDRTRVYAESKGWLACSFHAGTPMSSCGGENSHFRPRREPSMARSR